MYVPPRAQPVIREGGRVESRAAVRSSFDISVYNFDQLIEDPASDFAVSDGTLVTVVSGLLSSMVVIGPVSSTVVSALISFIVMSGSPCVCGKSRSGW